MRTQICGYAGKYLRIDLSAHTIRAEALEQRLLEYVGGVGIATRLFMDAYHPDLLPSDDGNPVILFTGPLTGTIVPTASRTAVVSLSPQTRALAVSNFGGFWGTALKHAGWDGIILEGRSTNWASIVIAGEEVRFEEAEYLLGKDTWEAQTELSARLRPEHPESIHVLAIGQAGESGVTYASLTANYFQSASRCGLGTVFGYKRLKAIAICDNGGQLAVADAPGLRERALYALGKHRSMPVLFGLDSYARTPSGLIEHGLMVNRNFDPTCTRMSFPADVARRIITNSPNYRKRGRSCNACPNSCFLSVELTHGKYKGLKHTGMVPSAVFSFAGLCGIRNFEAVWKCEEICDRLGMDMFSAATVISCVIALFQRGKISADDTDGLDLCWGDENCIFTLLHRIARGRGEFGRLLGRGSDAVAATYGGFSPSVKGLEMWGMDPRRVPLPYAVGDLLSLRGGDNIQNTHNMHFLLHRGPPDVEKEIVDRLQMPADLKKEIFASSLTPIGPRGIALLAKWGQEYNGLLNCLGTCILEQDILNFTLSAADHYGKLYTYATGLRLDADSISKLDRRISDMHKYVSQCAGFTAQHDQWPERFYEEPIQDGPTKGLVLDRKYIREVVQHYYELRAWRESGMP